MRDLIGVGGYHWRGWILVGYHFFAFISVIIFFANIEVEKRVQNWRQRLDREIFDDRWRKNDGVNQKKVVWVEPESIII